MTRTPPEAHRPAASASRGKPVPQPCNVPGKRKFLVEGQEFEVDDTYEPIKAIGRGTYGLVCSARVTSGAHENTLATEGASPDDKVAIKKISHAFESTIEATRAYREAALLRQLRHPNVISLRGVMMPSHVASGHLRDLYLVYDLMDTDLHRILQSKQPLSDEHFRFFLYQMLCGLKYLHSAGVLHRDLKPANLLLTAACDLKICDFGLARSVAASGAADAANGDVAAEMEMTTYVITRWYRAPELLLTSSHYTAAIDIWSIGCIIGEMLGRKPLFRGGTVLEQMSLIISALGTPTEADLAFLHGQDDIKEQIRKRFRGAPGKSFEAAFPNANPLALDLMRRMLRFNPTDRITAEEALSHPYLAPLHDPASEPAAPSRVDVAFEEEKLAAADIRERMRRWVTR